MQTGPAPRQGKSEPDYVTRMSRRAYTDDVALVRIKGILSVRSHFELRAGQVLPMTLSEGTGLRVPRFQTV